MRTRVIPAQITTVEDKIAGNLSLTQVIILLTPILFTTLVYAVLPPSMSFSLFKLTLVLLFSTIALTMSLRIKGKVVLHWLLVLAQYNLRPKYYVFNKNETFARAFDFPVLITTKKVSSKKKLEMPRVERPSIQELLQFNNLVTNRNYNLVYRTGRKGELNVAFEKVS